MPPDPQGSHELMQEETRALTLVGRRSSLFTRVPLFLAAALEVPLGFEPVMDMTDQSPAAYGGNPALKLPTLRAGGQLVFGAFNICRRLAAHAPDAALRARITWPEDLRDTIVLNAQEMLAHAMAAQVQHVMGVQVCALPADNAFFAKTRAGLAGALQWLDASLDAVLATLPRHRFLSLFEVSLFCLVEHLAFRRTVPLDAYPRLGRFAAEFGRHPAAQGTTYRFDQGAR